MRPPRITASLALLVIVLTGCEPPQPTSISDDELLAITNVVDKHLQNMLAGDWEADSVLFTPDAVRLAPNAPAAEGRAAIRSAQATFLGTYRDLTYTPIEIDGIASLAYVRGTYSWTATVLGARRDVQDRGKFLLILRKQEQEEVGWLIYVEMFNSDGRRR
jgi:ketosteroid isomerase-like protein